MGHSAPVPPGPCRRARAAPRAACRAATATRPPPVTTNWTRLVPLPVLTGRVNNHPPSSSPAAARARPRRTRAGRRAAGAGSNACIARSITPRARWAFPRPSSNRSMSSSTPGGGPGAAPRAQRPRRARRGWGGRAGAAAEGRLGATGGPEAGSRDWRVGRLGATGPCRMGCPRRAPTTRGGHARAQSAAAAAQTPARAGRRGRRQAGRAGLEAQRALPCAADAAHGAEGGTRRVQLVRGEGRGVSR
jgi:hypothetical protein